MKDYTKKPLTVFVSYIMGQKKLFAIDMACAVAVSAIDLLFPYISKNSMQTYLPQSMYKTFFIVMAILLGAYILKGLCYYFITVVGHRMGVLIEAQMREDLFDHVQTLSFDYFDRNRTGTVMSRLTNDLFEITELAHHGPENIVICTLTIIGAIILMFTINVKLTLVLVILLPLCLWFTMSQRIKMRDANIEVKRKTAVIFSALENSVSGIRTAKAFANEELEHDKFLAANDKFRSAKTEYYNTMGLFMSGMEFTLSIMPLAVIAFGGYLVMKGSLNYIELVTFTLYVTTFVTPIRKLAQFAELYMQGTAGFERFLELMRTEPTLNDRKDAKSLTNVKGRVEYRHVSFNYDKADVLHDVSITVEPGKTLALIGPSGGGKTTMSQLLMRFYDVNSGAVLVDGNDVRDLTQASLRQNIGMIQQDVYMFAGTVRENIRYGRLDATDAEVEAAAKLANAHFFISHLPQGYDTVLTADGANLSQGQRQLIAIARAAVADPPVLILDEATSSIDTRTEAHIERGMDQLMKGRTVFVIAHRLSTVRNSNAIMVLEHGEIIERGDHDDLIAQKGKYYQLYMGMFELS